MACKHCYFLYNFHNNFMQVNNMSFCKIARASLVAANGGSRIGWLGSGGQY